MVVSDFQNHTGFLILQQLCSPWQQLCSDRGIRETRARRYLCQAVWFFISIGHVMAGSSQQSSYALHCANDRLMHFFLQQKSIYGGYIETALII
jgi:hypothetical protein